MVCQKRSATKLRKASHDSIVKFKEAATQRSDSVFNRLHSCLDELDKRQIVWHPNCYKSYTNKRNLGFVTKSLQDQDLSAAAGPSGISRRSVTSSVDWSKCLFCSKASHKKDRQLHQVLTYSAEHAIHDGAQKLSDADLLFKITDIDLIAQEAKYHTLCYASFLEKIKRAQQSNLSSSDEDCTATAFQQLAKVSDNEIIQKQVMELSLFS